MLCSNTGDALPVFCYEVHNKGICVRCQYKYTHIKYQTCLSDNLNNVYYAKKNDVLTMILSTSHMN